MGSKVKICGLVRPEDIETANLCRPDYIGFVFADSRRRVSIEQAECLRAGLADGILAVGVFVNAPAQEAAWIAEKGIIDIIQLHGDEDEAYIRTIKKYTRKPVIKAVRVQSREQILKAEELPCEYLLLDTYTKGQYGGSGKGFDLSLIPSLKRPFFLAGGLNAENVSGALRESGAFAADVSSAVETGGYKDREKVEAFIRAVREQQTDTCRHYSFARSAQ